MNYFIAISENYCTWDQAGTKIMSVGFLCYFNKMSFNNMNYFIAISENYCTWDQAGTKIMSVGFLCYFNKMSFYYMLENF